MPEELRARHPEVPWKEMAGMRDKVIHEYFGIKVRTVWLVFQDRIPSIKPMIERVLQDLERRGA